MDYDGYIPKYASDEAEKFKKKFLRKNLKAASDLLYSFYYNKKGEAILEFTVVPKENYNWSVLTWTGFTWGSIRGSIGFNMINYTLTKKQHDEAQSRIEKRREDPVFTEIEKLVYKIARSYNYDFLGAYGIQVKYRRPNVKKAACEEYSGAVQKKFKNLPMVSKVEAWASEAGKHEWNVLILKNKRKLFCDVTWYGGNSIDKEGYVVDIPQKNPFNLTFDIDEFNSQGGAVNTATGKKLAVHFSWPDARLL